MNNPALLATLIALTLPQRKALARALILWAPADLRNAIQFVADRIANFPQAVILETDAALVRAFVPLALDVAMGKRDEATAQRACKALVSPMPLPRHSDCQAKTFAFTKAEKEIRAILVPEPPPQKPGPEFPWIHHAGPYQVPFRITSSKGGPVQCKSVHGETWTWDRKVWDDSCSKGVVTLGTRTPKQLEGMRKATVALLSGETPEPITIPRLAPEVPADPPTVPKHVTCGCCSAGCVCQNHMDIPRGIQPGPCAYHAALPFAPLDQSFRFDATIGEMVRVPQGKTQRPVQSWPPPPSPRTDQELGISYLDPSTPHTPTLVTGQAPVPDLDFGPRGQS